MADPADTPRRHTLLRDHADADADLGQPDGDREAAAGGLWAATLGRSAAVRFLVLSVASGVTNFALTAYFHEIVGLAEELSYLLALAVVLIQNFLGMRFLVYPGSATPWLEQFLQFVGATAGFRALEYGTFLALHSLLGVHYLVAVATIMVVFTIGKFVFYGRTIFAR